MKRMIICIMLLPLPLLCLQGCWDRTEINDLAFILTSAIDVEKDGQIRYTVLLPLPGQMGGATGGGGGTAGDKSYYIDSEVGETARDAQARLQARMSRRMYLAHRRIVLVSEELARLVGIRGVFDSTPRSSESRMTTNLIVTKGKAYELLQATPRFERFPSEAIRELAKSRMVLNMNMKDTAVMMSSPGSDTMILYMSVKDSEKSGKTSKEVMDAGYALFKDDKMVGVVEDKEAIGLAMLKRSNSESIITVNVKDDTKMSVRVNKAVPDVHVRMHNGKPRFDIELDIKARIVEVDGFYDLSQTANVTRVEDALSAIITSNIKQVIGVLLKKEIDPVQFGVYLWRAYPKLWKDQYASEWPAGMKNAEFNVKVTSIIMDTGLIHENVTKRGVPQ